MPADHQQADQSFAIPQKSKRWRAPVFISLIIVGLLAALLVYEARDLAYILPEPFKDTVSEAQFQEVIAQREVSFYVYGTLDAADQEKYRIVYDSLVNCSKHAFPTDNLNEIRRIEDCVMADHPEFADCAALVNTQGGFFTPAYVAGVALADEEQQSVMQAQIDEASRACFEGIVVSADDYTKVKHVYEWLAENTSYGKEYADRDDDRVIIKATGSESFTLDAGSSIYRDHGQTVYNALVEKRAVCGGYARAFQYLLQQLGIECTYVSGTALDDLHAWCLVKLDGDYYYIDPTWGDPEYDDYWDLMQTNQNLDYRYFAVTSDDIAHTHVADDAFALPLCWAIADNYYVREGLFFSTADAARFGYALREALQNDRSVSIRCASQDVYDELFYDWVETGEIGRYSPTGSYQYAGDESGLLTITIWPAYL